VARRTRDQQPAAAPKRPPPAKPSGGRSVAPARPQREGPEPGGQRVNPGDILYLQATAGNKAATQVVQRKPPDLSKARISYATEVQKAGLGPRVKRTRDRVLKEDLVVVRARVAGVANARAAGLSFKAAAEPLAVEAAAWVGNNVFEWKIRATVIGSHGISFWSPGLLGFPKALNSSVLHVLSDLSDFESAVSQAHIRLNRKFTDASKKLNEANTAYNAAYTSHDTALKEADRLERLDKELLLGLLFAGLGGFAGGMVGARMKSYWDSWGKDVSKKVLAEGGTDLAKDLVKFATRNARRLEGGSGAETTGDSTGPSEDIGGGGGKAEPVREDPLTMLTQIAGKLDGEKSKALKDLDDLMTKIRTAKGRTPDMTFDEDPLAIVERQDKEIDSILKGTTAKAKEYLEQLWGAWIEKFGYGATTGKRIRREIDKAAKQYGSTYMGWMLKYDPEGTRLGIKRAQEEAERNSMRGPGRI
jgi:hypothetical protein